MCASPIIPGVLYRVKGMGHNLVVFAKNPVDALVDVLLFLVDTPEAN